MKKLTSCRALLFVFMSVFSMASFAWDHSIELGVGHSHDPNNVRYNNTGVMVSGDWLPIKRTTYTFLSLTGTLSQWYTTAPQNKNLTTAAISLALRYYPFDFVNAYPAYFLASFGPALLSSRKFGVNSQSSHLTIQSNIGLGVEFKDIDVNLRLAHYSNAGIGKPNEGFNVLYMLSVGYLF